MIRRFAADDVESCVHIVHEAFRDDPLYVHMMQSDDEKLGFAKFLIRKALLLKELLIVALRDGEIAGIASLEKTSGNTFKSLLSVLKWSFIKEALLLKKSISGDRFDFINQYMRYTTAVRPKTPHHYLVFVGVLPAYQKQGVGREILEYLHGIVDADESSAGIGLDTENEINVAYYMHFRYEVIATKRIDDVDVYVMFRKRKE